MRERGERERRERKGKRACMYVCVCVCVQEAIQSDTLSSTKAGGGINFTVRHTHAATEEQLLALLLERMDRMLAQGTSV